MLIREHGSFGGDSKVNDVTGRMASTSRAVGLSTSKIRSLRRALSQIKKDPEMSPLTIGMTAAALLFAGAKPLLAQTAPEVQPSTDILVTTERAQKEEAVQGLARQVTGRLPFDRPIARFQNPLCLAIAGVKDTFVDGFAMRIIDNAKAADVPIARGECKANALVIFTSNTRRELQQARKKNRAIFGNLGPAALDKLLKSRDPAFAWRATQVLGTNGMPVQYDDREIPQNRTIEMSGRLKQPIMIGVTAAIVIIDRDAADGKTAQQLADYATLRLLAPTAEVTEITPGAPGTIMTLFLDPATAPEGLTAFDVAFLRGVYGIAGNVPASNLYGEVVNSLVKNR